MRYLIIADVQRKSPFWQEAIVGSGTMLQVDGLVKTYQSAHGEVQAVKSVSLSLPEGDLLTLLGPSGCGKTTTLRCVAGLEKPDAGEIVIDDRVVFSHARRINVPTYDRPIAMVFQSYAIWPHMTVFDNVAYPLRVGKHKPSKSQVQERVMRTLQLVRIPELAKRSATMLSGGQQQRVAVARALVREPKLLLLDEPLSNLDAQLREEMRLEFRELFATTGVSALFVTHDLSEALVLSDTIMVINHGVVAQKGTPSEVYRQPKDKFVAEFTGSGNVFSGTVQRIDGDRLRVDLGFGTVVCVTADRYTEGRDVKVVIRPEGVMLHRDPVDAETFDFPCRIETDAFLGSSMEYRIDVLGHRLRVRTPTGAGPFKRGDVAYAQIPPDSCAVIAEDQVERESEPAAAIAG
jgi:iron(III) transport system ATP-binding protein